MLYGPMGRFLDIVRSDGSRAGCCMVRFKPKKSIRGATYLHYGKGIVLNIRAISLSSHWVRLYLAKSRCYN